METFAGKMGIFILREEGEVWYAESNANEHGKKV